MDFTSSIPVALTLAIVQAIKVADKADRFAKFYSLIAIVVGLATGALFSTRQDNVLNLVQDAVQNAAYSALAWAAKKAVLDPVGAALPGDPKKGA